MSIEILCMRNAKGIDTQSAGRTTKITMDTSHVNAGCYGIDDIAQCLLDAHVCNDRSALQRLQREKSKKVGHSSQNNDGLLDSLLLSVKQVSYEMNWNITKNGHGKVRELTIMAIEGATIKPICRVCDGTKFKDNKPCNKCSATGLRRDNGTIMGKRLGVSKSAWSRTWQYRYQDIIAMLQTIMNRAGKRVNYQVFSE